VYEQFSAALVIREIKKKKENPWDFYFIPTRMVTNENDGK
jgi:hypothetical protein